MGKNRPAQNRTNQKNPRKSKTNQDRTNNKKHSQNSKQQATKRSLGKKHRTHFNPNPVHRRNPNSVQHSVHQPAASGGKINRGSSPGGSTLRQAGRKPVPRGPTTREPEAEPRNPETPARVLAGRILERRKAAKEGTRKQRGEISESQFFAKAVHMGFGVAKPWGDSDPYDFILDAGGARLQRVQLKSAFACTKEGGYTANATGNDYTQPYTKDDVDVLVAYIVPEDAWYVIPIEAFENIGGMKLFPASRRRRSRFEKYREAWCLLACKKEKLKRRPRLRVCWKCGNSGRCAVK